MEETSDTRCVRICVGSSDERRDRNHPGLRRQRFQPIRATAAAAHLLCSTTAGSRRRLSAAVLLPTPLQSFRWASCSGPSASRLAVAASACHLDNSSCPSWSLRSRWNGEVYPLLVCSNAADLCEDSAARISVTRHIARPPWRVTRHVSAFQLSAFQFFLPKQCHDHTGKNNRNPTDRREPPG